MTAMLDTRFRFRVHMLQLVLVVLAIVLSGIRLSTLTRQTTRSDTIAIVMVRTAVLPLSGKSEEELTTHSMQGVKSLVVLAYQLLTEHANKLRKWVSLKANTILNMLEVVFWLVVLILALMSNAWVCNGASFALSWLLALVALILMYGPFPSSLSLLFLLVSRELSLWLFPHAYTASSTPRALAGWAAGIYFLDFRHFRAYRTPRGQKSTHGGYGTTQF